MLKLLDLSGKIDEPTIGLYETLTEVARFLSARFFLVGATARDTILEKGFEIRAIRATRDIDIAVHVSGWSEFDRLKQALHDTGHFTETREAQRLFYRGEVLVDILPFGRIAEPNHRISWPPGHDFVMSTVGFEEAYEAAQLVRVRTNPPLDILVASLAGLAILKIVAWADTPSERNNDARDLVHIMENYLDAGNYDRLLEEHDDLVKVADFDYVKTGCRLLGRDIARIVSPETKAKVQETLRRETTGVSESRLIQQIVHGSAMAGEEGRRFDEILARLSELSIGIGEGHQ